MIYLNKYSIGQLIYAILNNFLMFAHIKEADAKSFMINKMKIIVFLTLKPSLRFKVQKNRNFVLTKE